MIVVDGREKAPYRFQGLRADANKQARPLAVKWQWGFLPTGDYSILGYEGRIAIERKSLEDLYGSLGQYRDRFEREHERMAKLEFAAVVIEASWKEILTRPPERSRLNPKVVFRTGMSWMVRFRVPWVMAEDRRLGEVTTFRLLDRWWRWTMETGEGGK